MADCLGKKCNPVSVHGDSPKVDFSPESLDDIAQAYEWYEERRAGLGDEFLGCLDACVQRLIRLPISFPIVYKDYRRALTRRFPYGVFFWVEQGMVKIIAVFHTSQHPNKWRRRSDNILG